MVELKSSTIFVLQKQITMSTATITKQQITSRVVYNAFREANETFNVEMVTFNNGYKEQFASFVSEVWNSQWCSLQELMAINKTTSKKAKQEFVNKYAAQFMSVPGRN